MNPLSKYLTEKNAGIGSDLMSGAREAFNAREIGGGVGRGALAAGGALGVGLAGAGVQKLYDVATKARDFKSMLESNPDLKAKQEENPRQFNQMFSTLRTFNPGFSRDPIVAGTYMRQMTESPLSAGGIATQALDYRDKLRNPLVENVSRAALGGGSKNKKHGK